MAFVLCGRTKKEDSECSVAAEAQPERCEAACVCLRLRRKYSSQYTEVCIFAADCSVASGPQSRNKNAPEPKGMYTSVEYQPTPNRRRVTTSQFSIMVKKRSCSLILNARPSRGFATSPKRTSIKCQSVRLTVVGCGCLVRLCLHHPPPMPRWSLLLKTLRQPFLVIPKNLDQLDVCMMMCIF